MLYPANLPPEKENHPEGRVFRALQKVANRYDIFWSRHFKAKYGQEKPEYEIDFIIADPGKAILCLEVKGGQIEYNGKENQWLQNNVARHSFTEQASNNAKSLLEHYQLNYKIAVDWGLCFPEGSKPKQLPQSLNNNNLLTSDELPDIESILPGMLKAVQDTYSTIDNHQAYGKFKSSLLNRIGFSQKLSGKINQHQQQVLQLSEQQWQAFSGLLANDQVVVEGCAGSGKTLLAGNTALHFAEEGKEVLFICFNRLLANFLQENIGAASPGITINTFHSLAEQIIKKYEPGWFSENNTSTSEFFDLLVPAKLDELIGFETRKYDVLIVDEGQDFDETWLEVISCLLKADGKFYFFHDPQQNIFKKQYEFFKNKSITRYNLSRNFRNHSLIADYVKRVKDTNNELENQAVIREKVAPETNVVKKVEKELVHLFNKQNVKPCQVVIMVNCNPLKSPFADQKTLAGRPLVFDSTLWGEDPNAILVTNIYRFKGLEAEVLFLLGNPGHQLAETGDKVLYCQLTRAINRLYHFV